MIHVPLDSKDSPSNRPVPSDKTALGSTSHLEIAKQAAIPMDAAATSGQTVAPGQDVG